MNSVYQNIYDIVLSIPFGRVTTYGIIADFLELRGGARQVGWALTNRLDADIPAHRVVNRNGRLSGRMHFATPTLMQELLEAEGLRIKNDSIIDFEKYLWYPSELLP